MGKLFTSTGIEYETSVALVIIQYLKIFISCNWGANPSFGQFLSEIIGAYFLSFLSNVFETVWVHLIILLGANNKTSLFFENYLNIFRFRHITLIMLKVPISNKFEIPAYFSVEGFNVQWGVISKYKAKSQIKA